VRCTRSLALPPGATLATARAELAGLAVQLALAHPNTNRQIGVAVLPVTSSPHGAHRELARPLLPLLGVCRLLLLIVCANLSNLLLVRASARQREICIRQALGARRFQLIRQLLAESLVLAAAGTGAGLLLTLWTAGLLRQFIPDPTLPISLVSHLDPAVLVVAILLSLSTALLTGLASILWTIRSDVMGGLCTGGRSAALSPRAERFRGILVIAHVAFAFVTLACAVLAAKSSNAVRRATWVLRRPASCLRASSSMPAVTVPPMKASRSSTIYSRYSPPCPASSRSHSRRTFRSA